MASTDQNAPQYAMEVRHVEIEPVRIQLSRAKGFNLQAASQEINGLPAVVVARPTEWGNPFAVGDPVDLKQAKRWGWWPLSQPDYVAPTQEAAALYPDWGNWLTDLEKEAMRLHGFGWGQTAPKTSKPAPGADFQPMCKDCMARGDATAASGIAPTGRNALDKERG